MGRLCCKYWIYIYNRGTWASGYALSNLSAYDTPSGVKITISSEASAVKIYSSSAGGENISSNIVSLKLSNTINFTAYKSVTFILSGCAGGWWNNSGNWTERFLHCMVVNSAGTTIASTSYSGDGYNPKTTEHTITVDVSSLNVTGYLRMEFVDIFESGGLTSTSRYKTTSYIHVIKLT